MDIVQDKMSAQFDVTLVKWGSSVGFAIPKAVREGMKLEPGKKVRLVLRENKLCIEKI
ncbi:MAG: AbrB/MazE/SpoVT family DNA-binding domain-containing protein [Thaumarchaeota archaeon]|nr:MAG: AbrB/MazE/SpoVT family DNA-binding domain-containing protein [Nitrososphaerota archaeon]